MRSFWRGTVGGVVGLMGGVLLVGSVVGLPGPDAVVAGVGPLVQGLDVGVLSEAGEGFSDIADAGGHRSSVELLAEEGILEGTECGPGRFCPQDPIQRWVMAVWLVRAVDGVEPDVVSSSRFVDVDPSVWWVGYVERLADLDITRGCSVEPVRFCPSDPVTREEMASFLVRAFGLEGVSGNKFVDVEEGNSHLADINALAGAGVTGGCGVQPDRYCPSRDTTRAQMATFLARAMGLVEIPVRDSSPSGLFVSVASGRYHTCGLRAEGTIACWGPNHYGEVDAPDGLFTDVVAGQSYSCGLQTDGTVTCWGIRVCERSTAGTLTCFPRDPPGRFTAISASPDGRHSCGLRTDGTVFCWGVNRFGETDAPDGVFTAVTAGQLSSCGLRTVGTVTCWGWDKAGATDPPGDVFTAVSSGGSLDGGHSCGLRADHTVVCWGNNSRGHGYYMGF